MPNTRRRRFSVQNDISGRDSSETQNSLKNSSSAIDLYNILSEEDTLTNVSYGTVTPKNLPTKMRDARLANRDIPHRRDKYPRQHRIKVRSPKRRLPVLDQNIQNTQEKNNDVEQRSVEISPIDWEQEVEVIIDHVTNLVAINEELPLMVDSLGIMLMSPLAVLAAWLSGRTLAGLMRQDSHAAPWPLASTFVLACMTLVSIITFILNFIRIIIISPFTSPLQGVRCSLEIIKKDGP
ncbi:unnamed protein product [Diatraea saccharalis]|uniref:Uncharacterized protein n=1 Tax=Diatraea saccharalis TaxID=40085 RepID=A0A9N9REC0_9NEOP|nr:unnamed protein product [Diatraea saccharalis]